MFNVPLAKLYTNSLMSTLNSRRIWKAASNAERSFGPPVGSGQRHMFNVNVARGDGGIRSSRVRSSFLLTVPRIALYPSPSPTFLMHGVLRCIYAYLGFCGRPLSGLSSASSSTR